MDRNNLKLAIDLSILSISWRKYHTFFSRKKLRYYIYITKLHHNDWISFSFVVSQKLSFEKSTKSSNQLNFSTSRQECSILLVENTSQHRLLDWISSSSAVSLKLSLRTKSRNPRTFNLEQFSDGNASHFSHEEYVTASTSRLNFFPPVFTKTVRVNVLTFKINSKERIKKKEKEIARERARGKTKKHFFNDLF